MIFLTLKKPTAAWKTTLALKYEHAVGKHDERKENFSAFPIGRGTGAYGGAWFVFAHRSQSFKASAWNLGDLASLLVTKAFVHKI